MVGDLRGCVTARGIFPARGRLRPQPVKSKCLAVVIFADADIVSEWDDRLNRN